MCTLIVGRDVVAPGTVLLAANRDEDPARPSDPPAVLGESPRLVGGRDRRAGGSWLVVRESRAAIAILNRRDRTGAPAPPSPDRRSRGALVLDVAGAAAIEGPARPAAGGAAEALARLPGAVGDRVAAAGLARAVAALEGARYAPCTLVCATPAAGWRMTLDADGPPRFEPLPPGWHVLTHADLDDPDEPRTARLLRELAGFRPRSPAEAERRLDELLRSHGDAAAGLPPVCLHQGPMVTVSSSSVWLAVGEARYRHAEGPPCEHAYVDHSHLLGAPIPGPTP